MIPVLLMFLLFPDTTSHYLAQAESPAGDLAPWAILFNTGVSGIWLWTLLTGKTHPHSEYVRVVTKLDAAENEIRRRNDEAMTVIVPLMTRTNDVLVRIVDRRDNTPPPPPKGTRRGGSDA
jgi:hypothetical protein